MGIFLGDKPVSVYFNGANASLPVQGVFLGGVQVFPAGSAVTVPGAPTINQTFSDFDVTVLIISPPADGGSAITGYAVYINGVLVEILDYVPPGVEGTATIYLTEEYVGQEAEVSAVNAIGEGPKSDPVTIVEF
jgi:hypothetical protein